MGLATLKLGQSQANHGALVSLPNSWSPVGDEIFIISVSCFSTDMNVSHFQVYHPKSLWGTCRPISLGIRGARRAKGGVAWPFVCGHQDGDPKDTSATIGFPSPQSIGRDFRLPGFGIKEGNAGLLRGSVWAQTQSSH